MTVEERARAAYYAHIAGYADDDLLDDHHRDEMVAAIASVATAAIAEEREACAKIADDLARRTREEWEENPLLSLRGTENCEAIRDAIRARGERL